MRTSYEDISLFDYVLPKKYQLKDPQIYFKTQKLKKLNFPHIQVQS